jgi:type IV secretory pathway VirB2 component (pilin)
MKQSRLNWESQALLGVLWILAAAALPEVAVAQAASPFDTGATALVTSVTTIATPIAVLLVMGLGVAAAAGQLSWGWPIGVIIGIGLIFAANPMVTWVRGLFGA